MGRTRKQEARGEDYVKFGNKIKKLRENKRMTQEELSNAIGISKTSIANYENGTRKVPLSIILQFSNFFGVTVDELLDIEIEKEEPSKQITKYEIAMEMGFTKDEIKVLESGTKKIPRKFFERFANYFGVDLSSFTGLRLESQREHAVITTDAILASRYKKWQSEIGYNHFTDEEIEQLIDYAKYLISKRKH